MKVIILNSKFKSNSIEGNGIIKLKKKTNVSGELCIIKVRNVHV